MFTPLHFCAQKGCLEGCQLLVKKKAKVNAKLSKNHRTPLHLAAAKGDVEVSGVSSNAP
jgi:ankyrin repeat protein